MSSTTATGTKDNTHVFSVLVILAGSFACYPCDWPQGTARTPQLLCVYLYPWAAV